VSFYGRCHNGKEVAEFSSALLAKALLCPSVCVPQSSALLAACPVCMEGHLRQQQMVCSVP
jgi:hypothetical protein